ncbi:hypothetical protein cyc_05521 [Cyclospora cayetanensis]|uniref:Transmembrane protein n=1 Tax=Cyclospora cayetanensis TaxID=88456 RepID=A0A1D3CSP3_9EIME|nr:hypothetical protein cyc_05521 [Cyclospora cayetanensis]
MFLYSQSQENPRRTHITADGDTGAHTHTHNDAFCLQSLGETLGVTREQEGSLFREKEGTKQAAIRYKSDGGKGIVTRFPSFPAVQKFPLLSLPGAVGALNALPKLPYAADKAEPAIRLLTMLSKETTKMPKTEVETLLLEIGAEMGRTATEMNPFVRKVVEENWLDTKESLIALKAEQWKQLGLPLRLETALKIRLGISAAVSPADKCSVSGGTATLSQTPVKSEAPTEDAALPADKHQVDEFSVEYGTPPEGLFVSSIEDALDALQREADSELLREAIRVVQQLLLGVLEQPTLPKRRKVRAANPTFSAKTGGDAAPPPLNLQVFTAEEMGRLDRQRQQQHQQHERWEEAPSSAGTLTPADVMRIKEVMSEGPSFQSRAKQQLEMLQKRPIFTECCVRLLLPNGLVLQMAFAPSQTLAFVQSTAAQVRQAGVSRLTDAPAVLQILRPFFRRALQQRALFALLLLSLYCIRFMLLAHTDALVVLVLLASFTMVVVVVM